MFYYVSSLSVFQNLGSVNKLYLKYRSQHFENLLYGEIPLCETWLLISFLHITSFRLQIS